SELAEGAPGERRDAVPAQERHGALVVEVLVVLAPAAHAPPGGGADDVEGGLAAGDGLGDGGGGQADAGAQFEDVDAAEPLAEDVDDAGGGVVAGGRQVEQRRLARAVGAEDHPALIGVDAPVDAVEELVVAASDGDAGQVEDAFRLCHGSMKPQYGKGVLLRRPRPEPRHYTGYIQWRSH